MKVNVKYWQHEKDFEWNSITGMEKFINKHMPTVMNFAFNESIEENYSCLDIYGESISPSECFARCRPDQFVEARTQWLEDTYKDLWEDLTNEGFASIGDDIYREVID